MNHRVFLIRAEIFLDALEVPPGPDCVRSGQVGPLGIGNGVFILPTLNCLLCLLANNQIFSRLLKIKDSNLSGWSLRNDIWTIMIIMLFRKTVVQMNEKRHWLAFGSGVDQDRIV